VQNGAVAIGADASKRYGSGSNEMRRPLECGVNDTVDNFHLFDEQRHHFERRLELFNNIIILHASHSKLLAESLTQHQKITGLNLLATVM
jgi:hypothetical protein